MVTSSPPVPTATVSGVVTSLTPSPTGSPSSTPTLTPTDLASPVPSWLTVWMLVLVALVIAAMFGLTLYNLSAPRSTLRNLLGIKRGPFGRYAAKPAIDLNAAGPDGRLIDALCLAARVNTRTTRTTLAITGFALLGIVLVALFGLSGPGVHDLRTQAVAAITTLVSAIAGFYFGTRSGQPGSASDGKTAGTGTASAVSGSTSAADSTPPAPPAPAPPVPTPPAPAPPAADV